MTPEDDGGGIPQRPIHRKGGRTGGPLPLRLREDIVKLVEAGLSRNTEQARAFAADLAAASGDDVLSRKVERLLGKALPSLTPLPADADSRVDLLQVFAPGEAPPPVYLTPHAEQAIAYFLSCCERADALEAAGLPAPRTALLHGPTGTGKTLAARHVAHALGRPLAVVRVDGVISSHLGQTGANLSRVFRWAKEHPCVLLLDELDAVGRARGGNPQDVGETWRVVVALLQLLDAHDGLALAATNRLDALDAALARRFEFRVEVSAPDARAREDMVRRWMASLCPPAVAAFVTDTAGWSGADLQTACRHAARLALLDSRAAVSDHDWSEARRFVGLEPADQGGRVGADTRRHRADGPRNRC